MLLKSLAAVVTGLGLLAAIAVALDPQLLTLTITWRPDALDSSVCHLPVWSSGLIDLLVGIADEIHELANAPQNDDT